MPNTEDCSTAASALPPTPGAQALGPPPFFVAPVPGAPAPRGFYDLLRQLELLPQEDSSEHELWLTAPMPLYPGELRAFSVSLPQARAAQSLGTSGETRVRLTRACPTQADGVAVSLRDAAMFLVVLQLSQEACAEEPLSTEVLSLCVEVIDRVAAGYYGRYVFARNALQDPALFYRFRDCLQVRGVTLNHGDTQQHRHDAIARRLPGGQALLDIGCGTGPYLEALAPRYACATGFEADVPTRSAAKRRLRGTGLGRVKVFGAFDTGTPVPDGSHVLMTEVLEHMPLELAESLLRYLASQGAALMLFTVPNHSFNRHYGMAEEALRHWDHHWEPTQAEFERLMRGALDCARWELTFEGVGDSVDGTYCGMMCTASTRYSRTPR